ncbi:MAG TPA: acetyltransferase, partial [Oculatellaceae cyanobacterium]
TLGLPVFRETIEGWTALHARQIRHFYIGIGMVKAAPQRWNIVNRLIQQGLEPLTLLHPSAIISPQADIEAGAFVGAGAIIQPFAKIGQAAIINSGAIVEHHVQIGCNSHVTPGTILCGESRVGEHAMLGAGSVVIQQKAIGDLVTIGAGSVVTEDIPARATAVGSPARILMPSSRSLGD